jgi:hypothetical protein
VRYTLEGSALPVSEALIEQLDVEWQRFARPGTWWTGAERLAIVEAARAARSCALCTERKAALSPTAVSGSHDGESSLPEVVVDAVHRITTDPGRLSSSWYESVIRSGVTPEQHVELTGMLGILTLGDSLARACGAPVPSLPTQAQPGEPKKQRPPGATVHNAWVPMVEPERAEGIVKLLYDRVQKGAGFVFNVVRALTLVPEEVVGFVGSFRISYSTDGLPPSGGLERPQMELLAASVSSMNDCFY